MARWLSQKDSHLMPDGVMKRTPEQGRIVITLNYTVPRHLWAAYSAENKVTVTDAVDCLRLNVKDFNNGILSLEELVDGADAVEVDATK